MVLFILMAFHSVSYAAPTSGMGLYGQVGVTNTYLKVRTSSQNYTNPTLLDWGIGGGFVIDTNCSGTHWFNYRFKVGYDYLFAKKSQPFTSMRVNFDNIFGFAFVRTQSVRIFIGPLLGIGYVWGNKTSERTFLGNEYPDPAYNYFVDGYTTEASMRTIPGLVYNPKSGTMVDRVSSVNLIRLSAGAALGINFNLSDKFTVSVDGGAKYTYVTGSWKRSIRDGYNAGWAYSIYRPTLREAREKLSGHGYEFFAGIAFMYRAHWIKNI